MQQKMTIMFMAIPTGEEGLGTWHSWPDLFLLDEQSWAGFVSVCGLESMAGFQVSDRPD